MKNRIGLFAVILLISMAFISCDELGGVDKPSNKTLAFFAFNNNVDDSMDRYGGTARGTLPLVFTTTGAKGAEITPDISYSLVLNGSDQYTDVLGLTQYFNGDFSVAAWINLDSLPSGGSIAPIVSKGSGTDAEFVFYVDSTGSLVLKLGNGTAEGYIVSTTGGVGTSFLYVAAVVKSNSVSLYINPKVTASNAAVVTALGSAFTGTRASGGSALQIGRYDNGTAPQFFGGVVDQVRIANYGYGGVDLAEYQDAED